MTFMVCKWELLTNYLTTTCWDDPSSGDGFIGSKRVTGNGWTGNGCDWGCNFFGRPRFQQHDALSDDRRRFGSRDDSLINTWSPRSMMDLIYRSQQYGDWALYISLFASTLREGNTYPQHWDQNDLEAKLSPPYHCRKPLAHPLENDRGISIMNSNAPRIWWNLQNHQVVAASCSVSFFP